MNSSGLIKIVPFDEKWRCVDKVFRIKNYGYPSITSYLIVILLICIALPGYARTISLKADEKLPEKLYQLLVDAEPGDEIILPEGHFGFSTDLSLFASNVTIRGRGMDKTILDFSGTKASAQALLIRANGATVKGLTIKNSPGDGVVARGVRDILLSGLRVIWDEKVREAGGYGLYPVQCDHVRVLDSQVIGAKEAGIYVGQSQYVRVLNNEVRKNVIGIDIENSSSVLVKDNVAKENSIGVLLSDRPYLVFKNASDIRVLNNFIAENNYSNFAEHASFAQLMGEGYGIKAIAVSNVNIRGNQFSGHKASDIYLADYDVLGRDYKGDPLYHKRINKVSIDSRQFTDLSTVRIIHQRVDLSEDADPRGRSGATAAQIVLATPIHPDLSEKPEDRFCIHSVGDIDRYEFFGFSGDFQKVAMRCPNS